MFTKILIANRGEIACRIMRTAHRLGMQCVAVYSDADKSAMHVRMADEAVYIGPSPSSESYLNAKKILQAAKETGAQAIHPGYGFLSENAAFSSTCAEAGIEFIGPDAKAIKAMGLKDKAKTIMENAAVPVVPGYQGDDQSDTRLQMEADKIGYPLLIKAVAGGGGKGMRLVETSKDFKALLKNCRGEGKVSFDNDQVLLEKYITKPRHIEVQIFGDSHGNVVHLFERDCSLQRRHQKVVEEAPAPGISEDFRNNIGEAAVKAAQAINYQGAGTVEFIVDSKSFDFYFMEMNTRLQVEHPVTEMITGQDLVEWQLRAAAGEKIPMQQEGLSIHGHAFEVRLYAEDPAQDFLPQTGKLQHFEFAYKDASIRLDSGVEAGDVITSYYDPMIAKLITHADSRDEAAQKMSDALAATYITGVKTNQEFLYNILTHADFLRAKLDTGFISKHAAKLLHDDYGQADNIDLAFLALSQFFEVPDPFDPWAQGDHWRMGTKIHRHINFTSNGQSHEIQFEISGKTVLFSYKNEKINATLLHQNHHEIHAEIHSQKHSAVLIQHGHVITIFRLGRVIHITLASHQDSGDEKGSGQMNAAMPGRIVDVLVKKGTRVEKDQPILVMESMKVEITIRAAVSGKIIELPVGKNDQVAEGALLVHIDDGST